MEEDPVPGWLRGRLLSERLPRRVRRLLALALAVYAEFTVRDGQLLAAAVSFFAFLSLVPLTLLGLAVASMVGGGVIAEAAAGAAGDLLTAEGQRVLQGVVQAEGGRGGATLVSLAVLLWSGLRVFRGLDRSFSHIYGSRSGGLVDVARDALVVLVALTLGLVGMGAASSVVGLLPLPPAVEGLGVVAVWLVLVAALLPMYTRFPDVAVPVREALPGAAVAALSFALLGSLFGAYAAVAGDYALYGLLGAVLLVLVWLNLVSTAVIAGAVLNAVLAGRIGDWRETWG